MLQPRSFTDGRVVGLQPFSTTQPALVEIGPPASPVDEHLASLPSLDDLVKQFREEDPKFDERLAAARRARYLELLAEVEAGRLSRLTAERLRLRLTQAELAKQAGMVQPNISRLEKPGATMSVSSARKLAAAMGLDDYRVLLP